MKKIIPFLAAFMFLIFIAGCQQPIKEGAGTPIAQEAPAETQPETQPAQQPQAEEAVISISISIISIPSSAEAGKSFNVGWKVESTIQKSITHTAIHYGTISRKYLVPLSTEIAPADTGYTNIAGLTSGTIPGIFSTTIDAPAEETIIYLRAHAVVDGKNYWSNEKAVKIEKTAQIKKFTIEGDDAGIYPASIEVNKGDIVEITFNVRSTGVYYGGLDFRSDYFNTGTIMPGNSKTVSFTADKSFTYTSYWPASGVRKADGNVVVK